MAAKAPKLQCRKCLSEGNDTLCSCIGRLGTTKQLGVQHLKTYLQLPMYQSWCPECALSSLFTKCFSACMQAMYVRAGPSSLPACSGLSTLQCTYCHPGAMFAKATMHREPQRATASKGLSEGSWQHAVPIQINAVCMGC